MDSVNIKELNDRIQQESSFVDLLTMEMNKVIVGQKSLIENLMIGLLANGHILLEGVPGLAKTLAINTLASAVDAKFSRIQFTPDLLPADLIGTMIYSQKSETFQIKKGPVFYGFLIVFMVAIGAMIVPQILSGGLSLGKKRIERNDLQARKAMNSLSVALGRYKFHVGEYPTDAEGLKVLAYRRPEELRLIRAAHPGWDGPYVDHIVKDPWGEEYVYATREEGGYPVLYSTGPDRRAGTVSFLIVGLGGAVGRFEAAFDDTSWTNHWAPAELRGIVVAPNEETRQRVEEEMRKY